MATTGNNNAGKPIGNSTQTQSNNQNQASQGNQAHEAQSNNTSNNLNQALHHVTNQAGAAPAVTPAISAAIPAHGVMYAANSVGNVPAEINNGEIVLAQNGNASSINTGNAIPITNATTAALNGATQYTPTNPEPITSASIETFFPFTPAPPTTGTIINPTVTLPNTLVAPGTTFADNVENVLSTSAPLGFNYGATGPINAGFPTTSISEGTLYTQPEGVALAPLITNNLIIPTTTVTPAPPVTDLGVTIAPHTGTIVPGTLDLYTITITNHGPTTVTSFNLTDILPASFNGVYSLSGFSLGNTTAGAPGTTPGDSWTGTLLSGQSITATLEGTVNPAATGTVVDTVNISDTTIGVTDSDTTDKSDSSLLTMTPQGDISIIKFDNDGGSSVTGSIGSVVPGNNNSLVYTITVSNTGPSTLSGASFIDNLPAAIAGDNWSVSGTTGTSESITSGTGNISDTLTIPTGGSITFTINATNVSSATGDLINTATITPENGFTNTNPNAGVNGSVSATDVDNLMTFTKTDNSGGVVAPTETFQYTVTIINTGTATVNGATVFDPLISNPNFVAGSTSWTATEIGGASGYTASGTNANIDDTNLILPSGSEVVYTVTATVAANADSTINNTASFTPPAGQTYNVSDTDNVVTLMKSDTTGGNSTTGAVGSFIAGVTETYHLVLDNTSPNTVSGVISDLLSSNPNYSSFTWTASDSDGTYTVSTPQTGNIDTSVVLPTGDVITYTIEATIAQTATAPIVNEGMFTPTGGNVPITAIDTDTLSYQGNIGITKVDNDGGSSITGAIGSVVPGNNNPLVYTITVSNTGPSNLVGAAFVDNLPSSILSDTWSVSGPAGTGATIISGTGNINDTITVGAGETLTFTIDATNVNSSATGDLINTATVTPENGFTNTNPNAGVNGSVSATDVDNLMTFTKTDNSGGVVAPTETFQYTVTIINTGTATVNGATVFDPLISNPNFVAGSTSWTATEIGGASGYTASGTNANIDDTNLILPSGSEVVYTVTATVAANADSTINNTASFTPPAGQTYNVSDTDNVVTLMKSDTTGGNSTTGAVGSFIAGVTETYHLVLDNTSPNTVSGVISDLLSSNPNYSSFTWTASDSDGTYTVSTPQTGNIDTSVVLPTGDVITYTIEATIAQTATAPIVNEGMFTPTGGNVPITAIDTDTLSYQGNIGITKVDNDGGSSITGAIGSVVPGNNNPLVYTITVSNTGPSNLVGAAFVDNLPSSILSDTWSVSGPAGTGATIISGTGNINDTITVGAGETLTFTIDATNVNSSATGDLINTATVTPENGFTNTNPNAGVNGSVSATDVDNLMTFTKTDNSGGVVAPTETFQYTVTIINTGTATVNGATVFDPLISNPNFVAGSTSWSATEIGGASGFTASGSNANIDDTNLILPSGSEVVYTVTATVAANAESTINNTASFTPPAGQTYYVSDTDNVVTLVKSDTTGGNSSTGAVGSFIAGASETYHLVLDNTSPNTVSGVVSDLLSSNPNYSSFTWTASDSDGTYTVSTPQTGNINASVVLPAGDVITYTIEATIAQNASAPITNEGVFTPTGGNVPITATDIDTLSAQGAISVIKVDSDGGSSITGTIGNAIPGTTITYTIVAADAGPSNLVAANVTDTLPSDLTSWTVTGPNGFTASGTNGGSFDDTNVNINAGGNATFTVTGTISPTATGEMTNTVTITPPESFTNTTPGSTTATDTDNLTPEVNLSIVKTDNDGGSSGGLVGTTTVPSSVGVVVPGQSYTYTIDITNSGPSTINHLTLSDVLPTGFTATGYNALEGSYNSTTGAWTGLTLASGDVVQLQITGYMAANALSVPADSVNGEIANVATVTVPAGVINTNPTNTATDIDSLTSVVKSDSGGGSSSNGIVGTIGTFVAGAAETYTITVSNPSVNAITGTIYDPLNATFLNDSWSTASTGGASANVSSGTGTIGSSATPITLTLPADSTITFTVSGTEALTATGTVANTVTYTPTGSQPVITTDYDNIVTVVKTDSSGGSSPTAAHPNGIIGTFVAGAQETYHITITNTSANVVTGSVSDSSYLSFFQASQPITWTVSTPLGAGDSVTSSSGTGAISGDSITLAAGSSVTFNITGVVDENAPSSVSNTVGFTPLGGTTIPVTDTDNVINLVKTDSSGGSSPTAANPNGIIGTFVAGASETYHITLTNNSTNAVTGSLSDSSYLSFFTGTTNWNVSTPLGAGDSVLNASGTGAISSDSLTIAAGSSITFNITGTVEQNAPSTVSNTADFTPTGGTTIGVTDTDNLVTVIKADSGGGTSPTVTNPNGVIGTFVAGAVESYTITIHNTSPDSISGSVSDSSYMSFFQNSLPINWSVGTLAAGDTVSIASGTDAITSDNITVAAGSSITFTVSGTVSETASSTVSNTVDFTPLGGTTIPITDTDNIITVVKTDSSGGSSPTATNPNGIIGTFVAGAQETYHITLTNTSTNAVTGSLSDSSYLSFFTGTTNWNVSTPLGAGDSVTTASGTGAISSDSLTIAAGSSITFNVTGTVEQNAPSTVSNTADFTPTGGTTIGVTDTDNLVTVVKADSGGGTSPTGTNPNGVIGTFVAGAVESYTITIHNTSPDSISGSVSDSSYLSFFQASQPITWSVGTLATGDTVSIDSGTGAISSDNITVAAGSSITFTVSGTVSETASSTVSNTVDFTPLGGTTIPITDTDNIITVVKTDSGGGSSPTAAHPNGVTGSFVDGASETYHITLTNTSPNSVTGSLSDSAYLSFFTGTTNWNVSTPLGAGDSVGTSSGTGAISNDSVTIAAGSSVTFNITGTLEQNAPSSVTNTADFTPTGGTAIPVSDTDNTANQAVLTISKTDNDGGSSVTNHEGTAIAGDSITYTIVVDNTGPSSAYNVSVVDTLPTQGLTGITTTMPGGVTFNSATDTWTIGTLAAGASDTLTLMGTIPSGATGSTYTNVATATSTDASTVQATDTDLLSQQATLTISKTDSDGGSSITNHEGTAIAGDSITYTIVVDNTGPSSAYNVSVVDTLPTQGLTGITTTMPGGVTFNSATDTWTIGTLAVGASDTLTLTGTIPSGATGSTYTNVAKATSSDASTVQATDTDLLSQQANLTLTKTDNDGGNVTPGESITYTIVVSNTGPSSAYNVSVADTLPTQGLSNISSINLPAGVTFNSATDTWTIGTLAVGASDTLTLVGTVPTSVSGSSYTNEATATASDATTVHAFDTDTITPICDVSIVKTAAIASPYVSEGETYTLSVQNNGPSSASSVTVTDVLPTGITYVSGSASNSGSFNASTDTLTWNLGTIAANASAINLTFQATINSYVYQVGTTTAASLAALESAWNYNGSTPPSTLHGYILGVSDESSTSPNNLDVTFANAAGTITANYVSGSDIGIGVTGTGSTSNEINTSSGQTETLVADLGHSNIESATITLSGLSSGSVGQVVAYNSSGVEVGGPILFQATGGSETTTITVNPGTDFEYLAFSAVSDGSVSQAASANGISATSAFTVQDIQSLPDSITNTATVSSSTSDSNLANNTSSITIHPEVPTANSATQGIAQGGAETNILIVLDRTGSMADDVTVNGQSVEKLQAAITAIDDLLSLYGDEGNVAVKLVDFNTSATILTSSWMSIAAVESLLTGITPSGETNYDAALGLHPDGIGINYTTGAEEAWTTTGSSGAGYIAGGTNVLYFVTDGGPNYPSGSAGINPEYTGNAGEETQWQTFLTTNNITAFAIALGISASTPASDSSGTNNDTVGQELTPIASNANDALFVTNYSQLSSTLTNTIVNQSGNILTETGSTFGTAGAGHIAAIALIGDGYTFDFNPSTNAITTVGAGSATESFNASTEMLTITSSTLGTLSVYMENSGSNHAGDYTYSAPSSITSTTALDVPVQFTIADSAGNQATGLLNIIDTHDAVVASNASGADQAVIVTIVDESSPHNSFSQLVDVPQGSSGAIALNLATEFTFTSGHDYAVSIEAGSTNTAALTISGLVVDGLNLQSSGSITLGGASNPLAATYQFDAPSSITQSETNSVSSTTNHSLVYYLDESGGSSVSATNTTSSSLADFLNGGNNETVNNTTSNPSVMVYNPTDIFNGNGQDILRVDQGATGMFLNTSNIVNLTGNTNIHNIGEILITDAPPAATGNTGSNGTTLTLTAQDVFDMTENSAHTASGNSNTLYINGNSADTVNIGSGWTNAGAVGNYTEYTQNVNSSLDHLYIMTQMHVVAH